MVLDLIFPKKCVGCGRRGRYVCKECEMGVGIQGESLGYTGVVRKAIKEIKYRGSSDMIDELVELWMKKIELERPAGLWIVTAVPMWEGKKKQRGFNQAELIARNIAAKWEYEYKELLVRKRETKAMYGLGERERRENVWGAFGMKSGISIVGKRVILIDDVVTTGATMQECENCLFVAGVKEVKTMAIAR